MLYIFLLLNIMTFFTFCSDDTQILVSDIQRMDIQRVTDSYDNLYFALLEDLRDQISNDIHDGIYKRVCQNLDNLITARLTSITSNASSKVDTFIQEQTQLRETERNIQQQQHQAQKQNHIKLVQIQELLAKLQDRVEENSLRNIPELVDRLERENSLLRSRMETLEQRFNNFADQKRKTKSISASSSSSSFSASSEDDDISRRATTQTARPTPIPVSLTAFSRTILDSPKHFNYTTFTDPAVPVTTSLEMPVTQNLRPLQLLAESRLDDEHLDDQDYKEVDDAIADITAIKKNEDSIDEFLVTAAIRFQPQRVQNLDWKRSC